MLRLLLYLIPAGTWIKHDGTSPCSKEIVSNVTLGFMSSIIFKIMLSISSKIVVLLIVGVYCFDLSGFAHSAGSDRKVWMLEKSRDGHNYPYLRFGSNNAMVKRHGC